MWSALLQVVPLSSVLQTNDRSAGDRLRSLALSVYSQCRRVLQQTVSGRSLTGFGPAAAATDRLSRTEVSFRFGSYMRVHVHVRVLRCFACSYI